MVLVGQSSWHDCLPCMLIELTKDSMWLHHSWNTNEKLHIRRTTVDMIGRRLTAWHTPQIIMTQTILGQKVLSTLNFEQCGQPETEVASLMQALTSADFWHPHRLSLQVPWCQTRETTRNNTLWTWWQIWRQIWRQACSVNETKCTWWMSMYYMYVCEVYILLTSEQIHRPIRLTATT